VASLLEVGTGFHPELSGRENIYLNGAILGMRRSEIVRQFDEIVAFAEIERFLDTPVKRYSSGMYMRLAFAVAAHLSPEILIIDEVLAVGDARFQRKCLGRMQEIGSGGRTVLFVSHNLGAVRQLCNVAMVMEAGRSLGIMPCEQAIELYQRRQQQEEHLSFGTGPLRFERVRINDCAAGADSTVFTGEPLRISLVYKCDTPGQDLCVSVAIKSLSSETGLLFSHNHLEEVRHRAGSAGETEVEFAALPIAPGRYAIDVQGWLDGNVVIAESRALEFTVEPVLSFASQTLHQSFPAQLMATARWSFRAQ
jgi:lipopolysaccharide transport system ATP-binding protein